MQTKCGVTSGFSLLASSDLLATWGWGGNNLPISHTKSPKGVNINLVRDPPDLEGVGGLPVLQLEVEPDPGGGLGHRVGEEQVGAALLGVRRGGGGVGHQDGRGATDLEKGEIH